MPTTLQIELEDLHQPDWSARYIGDRQRYATASSVRFIDPSTLICCSLLARKIYLIRFDLDTGSYETLDSASTMYDGNTAQTDLCDIDGLGHVITSNCEAGSMSLYRHDGYKIAYARDLNTKLAGNFCHGARFCGSSVVAAAVHREPRGVHFFDLHAMERLLYVETAHPAKDICFLPNGQAVLITTAGSPATGPQKDYISENLLIDFDLKRRCYDITKRQSYPAGQFDSAVVHDGHMFVVDGGRDCILVIDAATLQQVDQIDGYVFPHGIDINYGLMAITSYGTNSIYVRTLVRQAPNVGA